MITPGCIFPLRLVYHARKECWNIYGIRYELRVSSQNFFNSKLATHIIPIIALLDHYRPAVKESIVSNNISGPIVSLHLEIIRNFCFFIQTAVIPPVKDLLNFVSPAGPLEGPGRFVGLVSRIAYNPYWFKRRYSTRQIFHQPWNCILNVEKAEAVCLILEPVGVR